MRCRLSPPSSRTPARAVLNPMSFRDASSPAASSSPPARLMAPGAPRALCALIIAAATHFYAVGAQKSQCGKFEFLNSDLGVCLPCSSCKQYPKTPSCNTCKSVDQTPDVWKLAAITSFSVLAVVLVGAALIIGVMVHRRRSHKRPLRDPIEETAGPLYQA